MDILICTGGRNLRPGDKSNFAKANEAMARHAPDVVIVGNQRGGDQIWQAIAKDNACQLIVIEPTGPLIQRTDGQAYADRTRMLVQTAGLLWLEPVPVMGIRPECWALPGGIGTALCKRVSERAGFRVREFEWRA